jgi:hypothetical protein
MKTLLRPRFAWPLLLLAVFVAEASAQPQPPGLQIHCPSNITRFICSTSSSVVVNFAIPGTTIPDCPVRSPVVCVPPSGSTFPLGSTTVSCRVTNSCDQIATCFFTITVAHDTAPPVLACSNLTVFTGNPAGRFVYFASQVTTTDAEAIVSCVPPSGSWFPVGVTSVVGMARDACGNQQSCAFTVEVKLLKMLASHGTNGPQLSWDSDAMLESSDDVLGTWTLIRNATSPFQPNLVFVGGQRYFRLSALPGDADCGQVVLNPSQWNINVPSARVQGRFLLNGRPFPSSFLHGANFFLRRTSTGDEVYLGLSNNDTFDRRVVPGIYDVIYEHKIGNQVPLNTVAIVIEGMEISGDLAFDIDVPAVGVTGAFMFNGALAPANQVENGRVQARNQQNGALTLLGETKDQTYAAMLISGAYDFVYSALTSGNTAPANPLTAFQRNVFVTNNGVLNIDVPVIQLSGAFTVNGAPTPVTETESGRISFFDAETNTKVQLGETPTQTYVRLLIPGTYDVHYEGLTGANVMPANSSARFQKNVALLANGVFNINLPVVEISGKFRVNGAPAPNSATENSHITLRQGDDAVFLGQTSGGTFQRLVIPGTYQVHYQNLTGADTMPANTNAILSTRQITNTSIFDINIPVVEFNAEVTFNGGDFPGPTDGEVARLYLEASGAGGRIYLGYFPGPYDVSRLVVPGTYRVRYDYESGVLLPRNTYATLGSPLVVTQNVQTVINIGAAALSGAFTLNGAPFPAPGQNAAITLKSLTPGDSLYVGGTQAGSYSTVIVPGNYIAYYNWAQGDLIPRNQNARLICPR